MAQLRGLKYDTGLYYFMKASKNTTIYNYIQELNKMLYYNKI